MGIIEIILGSIFSAFILFKFVFKKKTVCSLGRVDGKNIVITGGNTGIGLETAKELAKRGAKTIIIGCRDLKKGEKALDEISKSGNEKLKVLLFPLDLGDFANVRKFSKSVENTNEKIHILVNNAGVMIGNTASTANGFETHFGINHLGHFLLTSLLQENLILAADETGEARIINVSSDGHKFALFQGLDVDHPRFGYDDWAYKGWFRFYRLYGQSKLSQIYHSRELARRLGSKGIISVSLHPGTVNTEITRYHESGFGTLATTFINQMVSLFGKSATDGALTTIHCCVSPSILLNNGAYFVDCENVETFTWFNDERKEKLLWEKSECFIKQQ